MRADIERALAITPASSARERTIDITTTGARTGRARRIEIWFYRVDGEIYLTTTPAGRDWYANLLAEPRFTVHLKHGVRADLPAVATPVLDEATRRHVFASVIDDLQQPSDPAGLRHAVPPLEAWLAGSPLMHVTFEEADDAR
ncbi:nitroreductase/quinone reductase family protein [Agrococcus sp. SGAir0287]|uniref:nitroreductase/quinone reductase family protein n=1 Tax=Agrococcus sp. SGAir0287 TaxID=2070347 RepID=UPI0010CCFF8A|nr:nitroreductase/quinone reductase family protein [Agrococcus sp. SGAir0287]QCR20424.1 nitroreductase family deazaflavin-dependent oxidoreductase [Agrococcus sp. SGAir0287]